jgi:MraZ protein
MGLGGSKWENMLLTGTHERTLDDKNRLALPKRVRELLGEAVTLFVTPGPDKSLWIYTEAELEKLAAKLDTAPATDAEARVFRRLYFAQTEAVDLDKSGRMLIPERLGKFAELSREVVLVGVRDHLELWDLARWTSYVAEHSARFDEVAEQAFTK